MKIRIRIILVCGKHGPNIFDIAEILGKQEAINSISLSI